MGKKGAKLSANAEQAASDLCERLSTLGAVTSRKMFGGVGVFCDEKMFALVDSEGKTFLKVGDSNDEFAALPGVSRHGRMPYYSVPADLLADTSQLEKWARLAAEAAMGG